MLLQCGAISKKTWLFYSMQQSAVFLNHGLCLQCALVHKNKPAIYDPTHPNKTQVCI